MKLASEYRGARKREARVRSLVWRLLERGYGAMKRKHKDQEAPIVVIMPKDDGKRVFRAKHLKVMRLAASLSRSAFDFRRARAGG